MGDDPIFCPFCGSDETEADEFDCEDREGTPTRVNCYECGCHGPWEYERDGSRLCVGRWNRRHVGPSMRPLVSLLDRTIDGLPDEAIVEFKVFGGSNEMSVGDIRSALAEQGE
jgi:hypothetical protein